MSLDAAGGRSFEAMSEEECLDLLHQGWMGRVAVIIAGVPAIFPVNYCAEGREIYFMTGEGSKLSAAVRSAVVAFEIDHADPVYHYGWSVLAVGEAHEIHDERIRASVAARLAPWAPGDRKHLIRIWPDFVSGRRVDSARPQH